MNKPKPKKCRVSLVRSAYQPSKKELAEAVVQPIEIDWKPRPGRAARGELG